MDLEDEIKAIIEDRIRQFQGDGQGMPMVDVLSRALAKDLLSHLPDACLVCVAAGRAGAAREKPE